MTPLEKWLDKNGVERKGLKVVSKSTAMGTHLYVQDASGKKHVPPRGFDKMYPGATAHDAVKKLTKKFGLDDE